MAASNSAVIRMMLSGQAAVQSGLDKTAASVGRLQRSVATYGAVADKAGGRSFLMNQALFTMRRYAYMATLGLDALATGAVYMGIKFNASMESNQIAFEQFLGSGQAARKELTYLFNLAKYTPFEFANVTDAARRFLAFGYSLKETNENLATIGDTVAAFGGGNEQISRMVTVFGQIRASGRLLGQDMLQLEQQGIPVIDILLKQFQKMGYAITRADLARIGELGIPANVGIPALMAGMKELFGGASARQAQTFNGQISTLHDNLSQLMGGLTLTSFKKASKGLLPSLNNMLGEMSALMIKQQNRITIAQVFGIAEKHYPWLTPFLNAVRQIMNFVRALAAAFQKLLLPSVIVLAKAFGGILYILIPVTTALKVFTSQSSWLSYVITILVFALMSEFIWTKRVAIAEFLARRATILLTIAKLTLQGAARLLKISFILLRAAIRGEMYVLIQSTVITNANALANSRLGVAIWLNTTLAYEWIIAQYRSIAAQLRMRAAAIVSAIALYLENSAVWALIVRFRLWIATMWASIVMMARERIAILLTMITMSRMAALMRRVAASMLASWIIGLGPIAWIIAGVIALIAILVVLYFKWRWFHNLVNKTAKWIWNHWKIVAAILVVVLGPMGLIAAMILVIARNWKLVWGWIQKVWKLMRKLFDWISDHWRIVAIAMLAPFAPVVAAILGVMEGFHILGKVIDGVIGKVKSLIGWIGKVPGWAKKVGGWVAAPFKWAGNTVGNVFGGGGGGGSSVNGFPLAPAVASGGALPVYGESSPIQSSIWNGKSQQYAYDWTTHTTINLDGKKVAESNAKHRQNKAARK